MQQAVVDAGPLESHWTLIPSLAEEVLRRFRSHSDTRVQLLGRRPGGGGLVQLDTPVQLAVGALLAGRPPADKFLAEGKHAFISFALFRLDELAEVTADRLAGAWDELFRRLREELRMTVYSASWMYEGFAIEISPKVTPTDEGRSQTSNEEGRKAHELLLIFWARKPFAYLEQAAASRTPPPSES